MQPKNKKLAVSNTSITGFPKFESSNLSELESVKNQVIEDYYNPDNTPWEKRTYSRIIKKIELAQDQYAEEHYWLNGKLPDDSKSVISFVEPEPQIHNEIDIGIESYSELETKIGMKEVVFQNIQTNKSIERSLIKLKWVKNLKIDILRILSIEPIVKLHHFDLRNPPSKNSIKNAVSGLRRDFRSLFPNMPDDSFEYSRKGKGYISPIKITFLESDEYQLEMSKALEEGYTYNPEYEQDERIHMIGETDKYELDD